jgi:uncharacterized membrane protein
MSTKRLAFIDLLRGWAVIVMIETHVTNATIIPSLRDASLFDVINFINGLVAPSFLFASGMAYAVTTRRKIDSYLSFGAPLFKQFGRLLFVLLIGYGLHLPRFSLYKITHEVEPREWLVFFQSDVLQCIAVSLLFLQVLLLIVKNERRLYQVAGAIALAIVALTPVMWSYDFLNVVPAPVAAYLNGRHHSLFPIFPWMAFLLAGAVTGYLFAEGRARAGESGAEAFGGKALHRFLIAGIAFIGISFPLMTVGMLSQEYAYWPLSPSFALLRIGIILLLCALMYWFELKKGVAKGSPVTLIGRESLLVYSVHLLLIYGKFSGWCYRNWVNHTFGYVEIAMWTILLLLFMYGLAWVWENVKQNRGERSRRSVQFATFATLVLVFVFGPGE